MVAYARALQREALKGRPNLHMTDIPEHRGPISGRGGLATGVSADQSQRALGEHKAGHGLGEVHTHTHGSSILRTHIHTHSLLKPKGGSLLYNKRKRE